MLYKINIVKGDKVIISYKSPIIPKHNEEIATKYGTFTVFRLGYIVCSREDGAVLSELDIFVS